MKTTLTILASTMLLLCSAFTQHTGVHFQIKKEAPAYGITLGWSLPADQLQKIVGDKFKPAAKDGKGFLMLFITNAKEYYLDGKEYHNLKLAHIVIPVEGDHVINAPLSIGAKKQEVNELLKQYDFKMEMGTADLDVKTVNDFILVTAEIATANGRIRLNASIPNKPGELKNFESTKITATGNPGSYFMGPEAYKALNIPEVRIRKDGINWISQLNLPAKPDRIWLATDFTWDFTFGMD